MFFNNELFNDVNHKKRAHKKVKQMIRPINTIFSEVLSISLQNYTDKAREIKEKIMVAAGERKVFGC